MAVRLQRYLAQAGVASRRKSEDLIAAGLVAVNGTVVTRAGSKVDPLRDVVTVRGEVVRPRFAETSPEAARALALHKPAGVLTARSDPGERPTVYDLVPEPRGARLVYVGRLDLNTEGLLLMTTHGRLAHRLTHPRWEVEREYVAEVTGPLDERALARGSQRGVDLADGRTKPFRARVVERAGAGPRARRRLVLVLTEGRNREVRRIVRACGGRVERLVRTRYAGVTLGGLPAGSWRWLERAEIDGLLETVGLPPTAEGKGKAEWS